MSTKSSKRPSFESVHYLLRPAKNVQRKMVCEALARLQTLKALSEYRYIGFSSVYYGDFVLVHKRLGINRMITIEANPDAEGRLRFNLPFDCIQIEMGFSTNVLPKLNLNAGPSIVWFDYDGVLTESIRVDVRSLAASVTPYSVIIVTIDARWKELLETVNSVEAPNPEEYEALTNADKIAQLTGDKKFLTADLKGDGLAETYRQSLTSQIEAGVSEQNRLKEEAGGAGRIACLQLFNFRYSDGAEMVTFGWLLYPENEAHRLAAADFDGLDFCCAGIDHYRIAAPKLTFHEIRELNRCLPLGQPPTHVPVSDDFKADYRKIYRYFPSFTEAEI